MKRTSLLLFIIAALLYGFATVGFQCSSAELTSARLYMQRQDWPNAAKSLQKEVEKNPQDAEAWYLLGRVDAELKDYAGMNTSFKNSLALTNQFQKDISDTRLHFWAQFFNQGVIDLQKGKDSTAYCDKAIESFTNAIAVLPDSVTTYRGLANAYLLKGDKENSLKTLEKVYSMQKDPVTGHLLGVRYFDIAEGYKKAFEDRNRDALEVARSLEGIRDKMRKEDAEKALGTANSVEIGKGKQAKEETWTYDKYNMVLKFVDGRLADRRFTRPLNLQIDSTDYRKAMEYYDKSVDVLTVASGLGPTSEPILADLSNALIAAGKANVARETFAKLLETNPNNKIAHYNLGVLELKANEFEEAIKNFTAAWNADPTYESALYNLVVCYVNWGVSMREKAQKAVEGTANQIDPAYKEKFQKAVPLLEQLLDKRQNDAELWELAGRLYANMNMTEKSKAAFDRSDKIRQGK